MIDVLFYGMLFSSLFSEDALHTEKYLVLISMTCDIDYWKEDNNYFNNEFYDAPSKFEYVLLNGTRREYLVPSFKELCEVS